MNQTVVQYISSLSLDGYRAHRKNRSARVVPVHLIIFSSVFIFYLFFWFVVRFCFSVFVFGSAEWRVLFRFFAKTGFAQWRGSTKSSMNYYIFKIDFGRCQSTSLPLSMCGFGIIRFGNLFCINWCLFHAKIVRIWKFFSSFIIIRWIYYYALFLSK